MLFLPLKLTFLLLLMPSCFHLGDLLLFPVQLLFLLVRGDHFSTHETVNLFLRVWYVIKPVNVDFIRLEENRINVLDLALTVLVHLGDRPVLELPLGFPL